MLEPRRNPSSRRPWLAVLLLLSGLLLAGAAAPLAAQGAEDPSPTAGPVESEAAEPPEPPEPPAVAPPAEESERGDRPRRRQRRNDAQVVVGSSLVVDEDETSDDVVVMGGSLTVLGEVYGDATAFGGAVTVEGRVMGDVAAIGGSVTLGPEAEVMGSATSVGGSVVREEGSVIHGEVVEVNGPGVHWSMWPRIFSWGDWGGDREDWFHVSPFDWAWSQAWRIFGLVVLVLLSFLALLLGRTPIDRIGRRVEAEPWKSGLVGLATQILFIPLLVILCVLLAISIIGIPFLLLVPFALLALVIVIFFGYVGVALKLGDLLRERFGWSIKSPYMVLLVGLGGLQVWTLIGHMINFDGPPLRLFAGLFLLFGFLVGYVAWTLATGGALLTRFGTGEGWSRRPIGPPPAPPAPAVEAPVAPPVLPADDGGEPWQPEVDDEETD